MSHLQLTQINNNKLKSKKKITKTIKIQNEYHKYARIRFVISMKLQINLENSECRINSGVFLPCCTWFSYLASTINEESLSFTPVNLVSI
jgi:hypothetical protein